MHNCWSANSAGGFEKCSIFSHKIRYYFPDFFVLKISSESWNCLSTQTVTKPDSDSKSFNTFHPPSPHSHPCFREWNCEIDRVKWFLGFLPHPKSITKRWIIIACWSFVFLFFFVVVETRWELFDFRKCAELGPARSERGLGVCANFSGRLEVLLLVKNPECAAAPQFGRVTGVLL